MAKSYLIRNESTTTVEGLVREGSAKRYEVVMTQKFDKRSLRKALDVLRRGQCVWCGGLLSKEDSTGWRGCTKCGHTIHKDEIAKLKSDVERELRRLSTNESKSHLTWNESTKRELWSPQRLVAMAADLIKDPNIQD
jgi:tRNA(Ile2) C34 agmatinyltransferase TiaS